MNYLEELRSHYGLTLQALAQQANVGKVKPGDLAVKLKKAAEDKPAQGDDTKRRHEIVVEELSNATLSGDCTEALTFVALVRLFQSRLDVCYLRPEAYAGYVEAARQALEQAEHLARGIFCADQANRVTNDELDVLGKKSEMEMAVKAFNRWEVTHAPKEESGQVLFRAGQMRIFRTEQESGGQQMMRSQNRRKAMSQGRAS